jgi:hypothetical protein
MSRQASSTWEVVPGGRRSPRSACDHSDRAGRQPRSTHATSGGSIDYTRCACGAWLVLLDGRLLAAAGGPSCARLLLLMPGDRGRELP